MEIGRDMEMANLFWKSGLFVTISCLLFVPLGFALTFSILYMLAGIGSDAEIGKIAFGGVWCGIVLFVFAIISAVLSLFPTPCPAISLNMYVISCIFLPTICGYTFTDMTFKRAIVAGFVLPMAIMGIVVTMLEQS